MTTLTDYERTFLVDITAHPLAAELARHLTQEARRALIHLLETKDAGVINGCYTATGQDLPGDAGMGYCEHCKKSTVQVYSGDGWICEICDQKTGYTPEVDRRVEIEATYLNIGDSLYQANRWNKIESIVRDGNLITVYIENRHIPLVFDPHFKVLAIQGLRPLSDDSEIWTPAINNAAILKRIEEIKRRVPFGESDMHEIAALQDDLIEVANFDNADQLEWGKLDGSYYDANEPPEKKHAFSERSTRVELVQPDKPDNFEFIVRSSITERIKVGATMTSGHGRTFGPWIHFEGVTLYPEDAQALIDVLRTALEEIERRVPNRGGYLVESRKGQFRMYHISPDGKTCACGQSPAGMTFKSKAAESAIHCGNCGRAIAGSGRVLSGYVAIEPSAFYVVYFTVAAGPFWTFKAAEAWRMDNPFGGEIVAGNDRALKACHDFVVIK